MIISTIVWIGWSCKLNIIWLHHNDQKIVLTFVHFITAFESQAVPNSFVVDLLSDKDQVSLLLVKLKMYSFGHPQHNQ